MVVVATPAGPRNDRAVLHSLAAAAFAALLLGTSGEAVRATEEPPAPARTDGALRVFVDCPDWLCNFDYLRRSITFVDYVRFRTDADVHVLVTHRITGSHGFELTMQFLGQGRFAGRDGQRVLITRGTDTEDERRIAIAQAFRLALLPYVAETPLGEKVVVSYEAPEGGDAPAAVAKDPWNAWLFRASVRGFFQGEESARYTNVNSSLNANRVTEELKNSVYVAHNYDERNFDYAGVTYTSISRYLVGGTYAVKSLGPRVSAGGGVSAFSSTRVNVHEGYRAAPAVELSAFPYSESSSRKLTAKYEVGVSRIRYAEETIFFKEEETLFDHSLDVGFDLTRKWGSTNVTVSGSTFLHDVEKSSASLNGSADLRLFKGLSLDFFGSVSLLRNQLYLPAAGATPEEVLLQRRQLATDYQYYLSAGLSYSFGSIYNNVVNPRIGGVGSPIF